jgi:hypothetical protein
VTTIQFGAGTFTALEEDGSALIQVERTGDLSGTSSVDFQTVDDPAAVRCDDTVNNHGVAYSRCDYSSTAMTVHFAPGESEKSVAVSLTDDTFVEGAETVQLHLSNPSGATFGVPVDATLTILDNDISPGPNPTSLTDFFVRQQYLDFLIREPEPAGFVAWSNVLQGCADPFNVDPNSPSAQCDRILVSSSFFGSPEFRLKGYFVFRFYRVAYARLPQYSEIFPDMESVTGMTSAEVFSLKAAFTESFSHRPEFIALYGGKSNDQYVGALMGAYQLTQVTAPDPASPDGTNKVTLNTTDLTNRLDAGTLTRGQVLRFVADSDEVANAEFNRAFVAMQYYGYLRRTPETDGFNSWLNYLIAHPTDFRTMVNGFLNSTEYRLRFGVPGP